MSEPGASEYVEIVGYADEYADAFARLNREWLERYSLLENGDLKHLEHPRESILATGGEIFIALIGGVVVGTCAAIVRNPKTVELAKLAVDGSVREQGIGLQLSQTVIAWARGRGSERVILLSSTRLEAALRLYERLGFKYGPLPADTGYETADIFMEAGAVMPPPHVEKIRVYLVLRVNKLSTLLLIAGSLLFADRQYVRKPSLPSLHRQGACPFECCTYRTWRTEKNTVAYAQPNKRSQRVGTFKAGTKVVGLTGEVRTRPSTFTVTKSHETYQPGDVLWVYTPLGEGVYKVWFKGKMREQELEFVSGPFEQSFPRCEETAECWGRLDKPLQGEWWVKIRSRDGWIGWTDQTENFSNMDSCA